MRDINEIREDLNVINEMLKRDADNADMFNLDKKFKEHLEEYQLRFQEILKGNN